MRARSKASAPTSVKADLQKKARRCQRQTGRGAQHKAEQGSQQLPGQVLELVLEEQMRRAFPVDTFEEVRARACAARDLLQPSPRVRCRRPAPCCGRRSAQGVGTRLALQAGDMRLGRRRRHSWDHDPAARAAAGPCLRPARGRVGDDLGRRVPLAAALRERVMEVHKQRLVSAGKGEKMETLYDYLTSPQFAQKLKAAHGVPHDGTTWPANAARWNSAGRDARNRSRPACRVHFAGDVQGCPRRRCSRSAGRRRRRGGVAGGVKERPRGPSGGAAASDASLD